MNSKWTPCTLGDVCSSISKTYKRNDKSVVLVNTSDILEGKILTTDEVPNENLRGQFKKTFKKGDILYSEIRPKNKRYALVDFESTDNFIASTKLMVLRPNEKVTPEFLYLLLTESKTIDYFQTQAESRSGTFPQITFSEVVAPLQIAIPTIKEQMKIAEVALGFDSKIDVNNKIIKTIGQILRVKHAKLTSRATETKKLDEIADVVDCLHSKKPVILDKGCNYIQLNAIGDDGLLFPDKVSKISPLDYKKWISRIEVSEGDCVITNVGRIGAVAKIPSGIKSAIGRNMTAIRLKKKFNIPTFLIQTLISDQMRREIDKRTDAGTIMGSLNVRSIPHLTFPWPSFDDIMRFEEQASQMRKLIEIKINENSSLKTLRDALLPKLLSGEIELKN